tara:strand:+ start:23 stop:760 length:738 start_codon:yes stop_codon:yes gene_type:complete
MSAEETNDTTEGVDTEIEYKYQDYINQPNEVGITSKGSIKQVKKNIRGLGEYAKLLISGGGKASKTGQPLGPQFFLRTKQNCMTTEGAEATRYVYVNHKPTGKGSFVSSAFGSNTSGAGGLIPGILGNLSTVNPGAVFTAFSESTKPECTELRMPVTPTENNDFKEEETQYVTINDIKSMDPCWFTLNNETNTETGVSCEGFTNIHNMQDSDCFVTLFYGSLGIVGLYLLFKFMQKNGSFRTLKK